MIFERCIDNYGGSWKVPIILAALRCDAKLYHEALHLYYKLNWCQVEMFKSRGPPRVAWISNKACENIHRLILEM